MKTAFLECEEWEKQIIQDLLKIDHIKFSEKELSAENVENYADFEIISTFIYSDLDLKVLEELDNLKMIATRSTGFDHIDMDYCKENDIVVTNVPTYGSRTVAEHVFGLLLTISHNLTEAIDRTRKGDFSQEGLSGFDLYGKILGIIGTGKIGRRAIEIARGFAMQVLAFDVKPDEELADKFGFEYVDFDRLLEESDVISLHVPANKKTRHMIAKDQFEKMKAGVVLINTSRGSVIDVEALVNALGSGKVRAAGLDVLPEEPVIREEAELLRSVFRREHNLETLLANHILLRLRNVVVTPHSAFNTREAVTRILKTSAENIRSFMEGKPQNEVSG